MSEEAGDEFNEAVPETLRDLNAGANSDDEASAGDAQHTLENEWTFWYDIGARSTQGKKESYESNLQSFATCKTIEEFWEIFNHMNLSSRLEIGANYHFFKKGIKPMWEDAQNMHGGKWVLTLSKAERQLLDSRWETVVIALIGELLDDDDEICGAVMSRRKMQDRISVWNRTKSDKQAILSIGQRLKKILGLDSGQLHYQTHEDSLRSGHGYTNPECFSI